MNEFPIIPGRGLVTKMSTELRQEFLRNNNLHIQDISKSSLDLSDIKNNIESYVGSTEIPLGIIGPLLFREQENIELTYCLAGTLEGALVASMNRGAKAISNSGGFSAIVNWQKMSRVPMFIFSTNLEAGLFEKFVKAQFLEIKKIAELYSNHATLMELNTTVHDLIVHVKFIYSTGDASGQNMTTVCTWHAMLFIVDIFKKEKGINPIDFIIEGNGSSDKKVSQFNIENGRGINVKAECFLSEKVINQTLRTTSEKLYQCFIPSQKMTILDGMIGYNINVANAIAAIYVATGQDLACIHESSVGFLNLEKVNDGLKLELNLTNLVIGTVGGGTHLPKQSEALKLMGCLGSGKVERFAKLICGFALGLEISTYAAIVSGEFAKAHEKLGRNKPVNWLTKSDITNEFLLEILDKDTDLKILDLKLGDADLIENGIITNIASKINKKLIGFIPLILHTENDDKEIHNSNLLIKSKALDEEVIKGLHIIAASIDPHLSDLFKSSKDNLEFYNSHIKEIKLYEYLNSINFPFIPKFYGSKIDTKREIYLFIQEFMDISTMRIYNSENNPELWKAADIYKVITVINTFHNQVNPLDLPSVQEFKPWNSLELYKNLIELAIKENEDNRNYTDLQNLLSEIDLLEKESSEINLPKTIIHNDFNSRNIFMDSNNDPVIYDWELAVIDFPHRDIVEFLSFVLCDDFSEMELMEYVRYHHYLNAKASWADYKKAYVYALKTYIACRISFYEVSGILIKYDFSKRILSNAFRMLKIIQSYE